MPRNPVVLITDADSDVGLERARELVAGGYQVIATARHVSGLTRILHGQKAGQVMAIAADLTDPTQRAQLLERANLRFGRIRWILDGRTGSVSALKASDSDFQVPPAAQYPALSRAS
jgi:NADP-dependent 3-hydroxy acid dehydrogenase YdfG